MNNFSSLSAMQYRKPHNLILAALSGFLFWLAWPARGFAPILFVAWIPLLFIEDHFYQYCEKKSGRRLFWTSYFAFLLWNLLTTWWIYNASLFGAVSAIVCNALFMAVVFRLFHFTRCKVGNVAGYASLIFYWIGFEYLHMNWDLSWPWLTLGNGFSAYYKWVQWYEYTGTLGGSVWVLIVNILLFLSIKKALIARRAYLFGKKIIAALLIILLPVSFSIVRYNGYKEISQPVSIAVVQPNIDPYNEKFSGMSAHEQLVKILRLASTVTDTATDYLVAPETAMPSGMWENELKSHPDMKLLRSYLKTFDNLTVVIGASTNEMYPDKTPHSATARKFTDSNGYYDSYNTAMQIDNFSDSIQLYHKSKLVPGVEKMPFPSVFKYIDKFAIDLGGMSGSLGIEKEPKNFTAHSSEKIAPVICYESIYGEYVADYVRKGAELLFIITNDGWWGDTPGYRQHLQYGRLRAIEMRRSIARSANTGISCFINQRGDISQPTKWWEDAAIRETINANNEITFYAAQGDYIARFALWLSLLLLALIGFKMFAKT